MLIQFDLTSFKTKQATVAALSLMCHSCGIFAWRGMPRCVKSLTGAVVVLQVRHVFRQMKQVKWLIGKTVQQFCELFQLGGK